MNGFLKFWEELSESFGEKSGQDPTSPFLFILFFVNQNLTLLNTFTSSKHFSMSTFSSIFKLLENEGHFDIFTSRSVLDRYFLDDFLSTTFKLSLLTTNFIFYLYLEVFQFSLISSTSYLSKSPFFGVSFSFIGFNAT